MASFEFQSSDLARVAHNLVRAALVNSGSGLLPEAAGARLIKSARPLKGSRNLTRPPTGHPFGPVAAVFIDQI